MTKHIDSLSFNLPIDNVDTDQIIPAQFLTTTERRGLGQYCFYHWRQEPAANDERLFSGFDPARHRILVAGANFGCGSSREHAPWALLDMGFRAVISTRIADIFRSNALKNGLLPVVLDAEAVDFLLQHGQTALSIDIAARTVDIPGYRTVSFPLDAFSAYCLIEGIDTLDFLLSKQDLITRFEAR